MKFVYVIKSIVASGFLPILSAEGGAWSIEVDRKPVGVVSGKWEEPRTLFEPNAELRLVCGENRSTIFFRYHAQEDPEAVLLSLSCK